MILATIRSNDAHPRNGRLVVVSSDHSKAVKPTFCQTLIEAVQSWKETSGKLKSLSDALNSGTAADSFSLNLSDCLAPLPYAPGFYDGSAFLSHVHRARKSRGDTMPESAKITPLMYQGVSDNLLAHNSPLELMDADFGGDFEGEFAVITDDVPRGTPADQMGPHMILFSLFNDVTYREIVKVEIQTKFGFLQSKPNSSFAPFVVTPDELGTLWKDGRIHGDVEVKLNGETFGTPNGKEMNFSFHELVAHANRTRPLSAGTIVGTGTVSNEDKGKGFACLTEKRFQEILDDGSPKTPWLKVGDTVSMNFYKDGQSVFGPIDQSVVL